MNLCQKNRGGLINKILYIHKGINRRPIRSPFSDVYAYSNRYHRLDCSLCSCCCRPYIHRFSLFHT